MRAQGPPATPACRRRLARHAFSDRGSCKRGIEWIAAQRRERAVDEAGVDAPGAEFRRRRDRGEKCEVGLRPGDADPAERSGEPRDRLVPVGAGRNHLGEHGVVIGADDGALLHAAIDAEPGTGGEGERRNPPGRGTEIGGRIFRIEPCLDRVAAEGDLLLAARQRLAGRYA